MTLPPLKNLLAFIHSVESGRLCTAAKTLNVTESAVSHQLARLEAQLGIRLLERSVQGVKLTEPGRRFYQQIRPAVNDIERAVHLVRDKSRYRVSITMPQSFAAMWFSPRLQLMINAIPDIEIDMLPTQRVVDLQREGLDFGVRTFAHPLENETTTLLLQETLSPVCTPDNAERIQKIGWEAFIQEKDLILNQLHPEEWQQWAQQYDMALPSDKRYRRLSSFDLVNNAVISGLGIAIGRTPLINTALSLGALVQPFPEYCIKSAYYHLVTARIPPLQGIHQQFHEWLIAEMSAN